MKAEYDIKKLRLKRRGILPALKAEKAAGNKIRITISLDKEIVDYFKGESNHPGAFPYLTQINQMLRQLIDKHGDTQFSNLETLKTELLHDSTFIRKLAKQINQGRAGK